MCVQLLSGLREEYPDIGLLFALAEIGDNRYYDKIRMKINELGIQENIHFMLGQKELWPLFKKADLMVRPTYIDGYGISVAEALYLGCPAIASDVCKRPDGTILFRNRDEDDLLEKAKMVLSDAS
jgi:glycosyltransferase involved in cell wall biosynthesis